jgi:membrane protein DedA with SNARE-associated domain
MSPLLFVLLQAKYAPNWLQSSLNSEFAYLVFFGLCVLEGLMLLRFMPTELVVPSALFFIGSSPPEVVGIVTIAIVGTTVGQVALFVLVRRAGREYVLRKRWFPVGAERLETFDEWFDRWGRLAVPASNTMLFVRGLMTFPAGLSEMDWRTFLVLSVLGSTSFQTILAGIYLYAEQVVVIG